VDRNRILAQLLTGGIVAGVAVSIFGAFWFLLDVISFILNPVVDILTFYWFLTLPFTNTGLFIFIIGMGFMVFFFLIIAFMVIYKRGYGAIYEALNKQPIQWTESELIETKKERRIANFISWGLIISLVIILFGMLFSPISSLSGSGGSWPVTLLIIILSIATRFLGLDILLLGLTILLGFLILTALALLIKYGHRFFLKLFFKINK